MARQEGSTTDAMMNFGYDGVQVPNSPKKETDEFQVFWMSAVSLLAERKKLISTEGYRLIDRLNDGPIPTEFGDWTLIAMGDQLSGTIHEVLVYGDIANGALGDGEDVPVYIAFSDHFGEVYLQRGREKSKRNLHGAMKHIGTEGRGVIITLKNDGEGKGVTTELERLNHQYFWVQMMQLRVCMIWKTR
ncbi:MAG: hypothetical protein ABI425_04565 [Patescibacteria group bacterium]